MAQNPNATHEYQGTQVPVPGDYQLDTAHSSVTFSVRHMMVSKVRGSFGSVSGTATIGEDPTDSSLEVTIDPASITTGEESRDGHLRSGDFLDVENHPEITFVSTGVRDFDGSGFTLDGDLTVHGITHRVSLQASYEGAGASPFGFNVAGFSGHVRIDRETFGLTWNQALETGGVMVGKDVDINIEAELIPADAGS